MRKLCLCVLAIALSVQPSMLEAKELLELAPSSPWNLDYDEEACRLGRTFGKGDNKTTLILAKYAPGTRIEVLISGKPVKANSSRRFVYSFDPQEDRDVERPLFGELEDGGTIWQFTSGLASEAELKRLHDADADLAAWYEADKSAARTISSISILRGVEQPVRLRTGKLAEALDAMDVCLGDLVKSWGFDPIEQRNLAKGPQPVISPARWINSQDYPGEALRKDLAGAVRFRLAINQDGRVTDCVIQSSYSHPDFSAAVCEVFMKEGRFDPARNTAGEAVASYWSNSVLFTPN